jgi:hypothetical protein
MNGLRATARDVEEYVSALRRASRQRDPERVAIACEHRRSSLADRMWSIVTAIG